MQRMLAAVTDVALSGLVGALGFWVALHVAPCQDQSSCPVLTPLIVVFVLAGLVLYFGSGYLSWHSTPGERVFHPVRDDD